MKTAFAAWNKRIAPVFDVARYLHIVEFDEGRIIAQSQEALADDGPTHRALRLARMEIRVLVCGAISRQLQTMIEAYGIRVVPFVAGDLREVIEAWFHKRLEKDMFAMPGCHGRGLRQGRGVQRLGRRSGPWIAGPGGFCVCPQCGHREPHEQGRPCTQMRCPTCKVALMRQ
jgi:predicted Fe-Mo cluster-binding NifX family protein